MEAHAAPALLLAIEHSALGEAARHSTWLYPTAGVVHLIGLGLLIGSILALDLRLLGASKRLVLGPAARHLIPIAVLGFLLSATTGVVMFAADASHLFGNPAFRIKLALICLAGLNIALFHRWSYPRVGQAGPDARVPVRARVSAALSAGLWLSVLTAGRLIAYF